jgi:hypothetical protein
LYGHNTVSPVDFSLAWLVSIAKQSLKGLLSRASATPLAKPCHALE